MYRNVEKWINDEDRALSLEEKHMREALDSLQKELSTVEVIIIRILLKLEHSHLTYLLETTQNENNISALRNIVEDDSNSSTVSNQPEIQYLNIDDSEQINLQDIDLDLSEEENINHVDEIDEVDEIESELDDIISTLHG